MWFVRGVGGGRRLRVGDMRGWLRHECVCRMGIWLTKGGWEGCEDILNSWLAITITKRAVKSAAKLRGK